MAYEKQTWVDNTTPVNAEHLNHMEDGIAANSADLTDMSFLGVSGTSIPSGADLDDYTDCGKYFSQNGTITATLVNCPFTSGGFSMYVLQQANSANYRYQIITRSTSTSSKIYVRWLDSSAASPASWILLPSSDDLANKADQSEVDQLSADLTDIDIMGATGTAINSGDDLNDYLTPGKYYSQNSTISGSLTNAPFTTAGFNLYVFKQVISSNTVYQIIFRSSATLNTLIYYRAVISGTYGDWYSIAGTAVSTTSLANEVPEDIKED